VDAKRWSREYQTRVINEDIVGMERVSDISLMDRLAMRLPCLVGSPLSINSLREDLQVSHQTVSRWVDILERLYLLFRIYPFGSPILRAVKKEAKHYHYDWTQVDSPGARLENLVAMHLYALCLRVGDTQGRDVELRYFRDIDKREVDFVVIEKNRTLCFIEVKTADESIAPGLKYLKTRFPDVPAIQVVLNCATDNVDKGGFRIVSVKSFFAAGGVADELITKTA
jgi:predicted AAA+ superfamily ATPase